MKTWNNRDYNLRIFVAKLAFFMVVLTTIGVLFMTGCANPADSGNKPADSSSKPADSGSKPADSGKPADDSGKPADDSSKPADDSSKPAAIDGGTAPATDGTTTNPNPTVSVTGVSLNKSSTSILVGAIETLTSAITPTNATNQNLTWSSNNTAVATVSTGGVVTAVAAGTATITVTTVDGGKTASCTVNVTNTAVAVTGVFLNKSSTSLNVGNNEELIATIIPTNATNQVVTWVSSNTAAATVSEGGVITARNVGTATIIINTDDGGKTALCTVTVNPKVINFTVDAIPVQTYTGSPIQPTVTVKDGSTILTLNTDYTVKYTDNTNAGTATVTISGAGNYAGNTGSATFTILQTVLPGRIEYYWVDQYGVLVTTGGNTATVAAGATLTITAQGTGYTVNQWYLDGLNTGQNGIAYNFSSPTSGVHIVSLFVEKGGKLYNTTITITVQ